MGIAFAKLEGAGNGYLAVDGREASRDWSAGFRVVEFFDTPRVVLDQEEKPALQVGRESCGGDLLAQALAVLGLGGFAW